MAHRHSGYLVGGTSPFGTRRAMPVYIEESILQLPRIAHQWGRRGYLVQLDPQVCVRLLAAGRCSARWRNRLAEWAPPVPCRQGRLL